MADQANKGSSETGPCENAGLKNVKSEDTGSDCGGSPCDSDRRTFLSTSTLAMAAALAGSYGTFGVMAGQYFFPSGDNKTWLFVSNAKGFEPGTSLDFESPHGVKVSITRDDKVTEEGPTIENFLALSSVCPHLGCRVHWEGHNDRFFCPCHNGVFDPSGKATGGPPAADGQDLPQYPLKIVNGALYIEMPFRSV